MGGCLVLSEARKSRCHRAPVFLMTKFVLRNPRNSFFFYFEITFNFRKLLITEFGKKTSNEPVMDQLLADHYRRVRNDSVAICSALAPEDYVCQPELFVSPPKWHLAHSTWFFEHFIAGRFINGYKPFHPKFHYLFNSYYETAGEHLLRQNRGALSRPGIDEIMKYRAYVDEAIGGILTGGAGKEIHDLVVTGLNHEQQHQELLWMDIKYILGKNPLFPPYHPSMKLRAYSPVTGRTSRTVCEGVYRIGFSGSDFSFDNERPEHSVYLNEFSLCPDYTTNREYLDFIEDKGYSRVDLWHSDGWEWVKQNRITAPLYWYNVDGRWFEYTFDGLSPIVQTNPVMHVSHYEAFAFATWKQSRLPTEFEWEASSDLINWGFLWEHTSSAYLPYPGYRKPEGTLGEYNAKFMVNQMVLRGACFATPQGHERRTYRNFFSPDMRSQFAGIRLVQSI